MAADDWIKWTKGFLKKPELMASARILRLDIYASAARWMIFWEWADGQTVDGWIEHVTPEDVDLVAGLPGFAAAAVEVKWLIFQDNGLLIPNFTRHNGQSAKKRALGAERNRRYRTRQRSSAGDA